MWCLLRFFESYSSVSFYLIFFKESKLGYFLKVLKIYWMERERQRFAVPLIYALTGCFLCVPWPGVQLATLAYRDYTPASWATWPGQTWVLLKKKKKDFTHLFIYFRERGREAKRGRETLISCLACTLTRSQTGDLQFAGRCPTQEPHLGKPGYFLKPLFIRLMVGFSTSVFFCLSDENQCRANSALLCTLTHK